MMLMEIEKKSPAIDSAGLSWFSYLMCLIISVSAVSSAWG